MHKNSNLNHFNSFSKEAIFRVLHAVAPVGWVYGIVWKKSEKFAGAAEANTRLMIDRAPIG